MLDENGQEIAMRSCDFYTYVDSPKATGEINNQVVFSEIMNYITNKAAWDTAAAK